MGGWTRTAPGNGRRALPVRRKREKARCKPIGQGDSHTHGHSLLYALCIVKHATWYLRVPLRRLTLGEPFLEQAVLIPFDLEL